MKARNITPIITTPMSSARRASHFSVLSGMITLALAQQDLCGQKKQRRPLGKAGAAVQLHRVDLVAHARHPGLGEIGGEIFLLCEFTERLLVGRIDFELLRLEEV